ncbi:peptide ABC transporter permease, partial [Acinetobacter baumannii]
MGSYILKRLLLMIPTLFVILLINFVVVQIAPGWPVVQAIHQAQSDLGIG